MRFPFVKRKDYEEVVDKLECLLDFATGGKLSKASYPLVTMIGVAYDYIRNCCDEEVEEQTKELKNDIEQWKEEANRYQKLWCEAEAENEKLHPYKLHYGNLRMEIAREFADRLKAKAWIMQYCEDGIINRLIAETDIDNLLKEMEKKCDSV
jgi:DNA phosphorothioation-dependent restriction protein DptG